MDFADDALVGGGARPRDTGMAEKARTQFVSEVISLLQNALSRNLLSFTAVRAMNYEEVQIRLPYGEYCIVLGRSDNRQKYRPYAAVHTFRICNPREENVHWFEPLTLDDESIPQGESWALRDRLAGLHYLLMDNAPQNVSELSVHLFEYNRFLRRLQDSTRGIL